MRLGVIAGSGFDAVLKPRQSFDVETPWGDVTLHEARWKDGTDVLLAPRHGTGHRTGPHAVSFRALVQAMADAKPDYVLGLNNVGGLKRAYPPGTWVVASDFLDLAEPSRGTFFLDRAVHTDLTKPYCPHLRDALARGAAVAGVEAKPGVYVTMPGPRLETPAEVRLLSEVADVVGMTGAPEASLAKERGLCYAQLCLVSNLAAGLQDALPARQIVNIGRARLRGALDIVRGAAAALPATKNCDCARAPELARL